MIIKNGIVISIDDGIKIIQDLIPITNTKARPQIKMTPQYITIHNTGNPNASAKSNSTYVDNQTGYVSWHFTVGFNEVYQEMPITEHAWHAGDGANGDGNIKSIGIEIAEVDGAEETAIKFVAQLLKATNLTIDKVVPHKHWSGKNCPRLILPHWNLFISNIETAMNPIKVKTFTLAEAKIYVQQETKIDDNTKSYLSGYKYDESLFIKLATAIYEKKYRLLYQGKIITELLAVEILKKIGLADNTIQFLQDDYKFGENLVIKLATAMV